MRVLFRIIRFDISRLRTSLPGLWLLWSDIVARTPWRLAHSLVGLNRACVKVHWDVACFVVGNGRVVVRHGELKVDMRQ